MMPVKRDPLLDRLKAFHGVTTGQADDFPKAGGLPPVIIRYQGRLAACLDSVGTKIRIKDFATGAERVIERNEIAEAE